MLRLEHDRPTSLASLGRISLTAVFFAVAMIAFVVPWFVRLDAATISPGEHVAVLTDGTYDAPGGLVKVIKIGDMESVVETPGGERFTVPSQHLRDR